MPIYAKKKQVGIIQIGTKLLSSVYLRNTLRWQAVRSCFGSGIWINTKPWLNNEGYKNN